MKYIIMLMLVLTFAFGVTKQAAAQEESIYVEGQVTAYVKGQSITIVDVDEQTLTFQVTDQTKVMGDIARGVDVEIEASGDNALSIRALGDGEDGGEDSGEDAAPEEL